MKPMGRVLEKRDSPLSRLPLFIDMHRGTIRTVTVKLMLVSRHAD